MDHSLEIIVSSVINAPIEQAWQALVNPATIKQYMFGTDVTSNWQVGEEIIFEGVWEGKPYRDKGKITNIQPEKVLQYQFYSAFSGLEDTAENHSLITFHLEEDEPGHVVLTITQKGFTDSAMMEHTRENWLKVIGRYKAEVEK